MLKQTAKLMGLSAVAVLALSACGDSTRASADDGVITLAKADPIPVETMPVVSEPVATETKHVNVTYGDAERVFRRGRYGEAKELFEAYTTNHPDDMQGQYMLGLSAWKSGEHKLAEKALLCAAELDSGNVKVRTNLARVLLEQGRPGDALPHIEKAVDVKPDSHEVWRVLGNTYADLGRSNEALEAYRQAIMLKDNDAWSINNYGLLLVRLGRYEDALPALARAVELNPNSPVFRNNLGVALERTDKLGSAREQFEAALKADSGYVKAQVSLERVQKRLGDQPGVTADLDALAQSFINTVLRWREDAEAPQYEP